jgi:hypothetical protein
MTEQPIACSLDRGDLAARMVAAAEVGRAGLVARERTRDRHLLRFRSDPLNRGRLEKIIEAERQCCPFLSITLVERGSELELAIEAPAGSEEFADGLAAAFAGVQA